MLNKIQMKNLNYCLKLNFTPSCLCQSSNELYVKTIAIKVLVQILRNPTPPTSSYEAPFLCTLPLFTHCDQTRASHSGNHASSYVANLAAPCQSQELESFKRVARPQGPLLTLAWLMSWEKAKISLSLLITSPKHLIEWLLLSWS